jgi:hypothetical protein
LKTRRRCEAGDYSKAPEAASSRRRLAASRQTPGPGAIAIAIGEQLDGFPRRLIRECGDEARADRLQHAKDLAPGRSTARPGLGC